MDNINNNLDIIDIKKENEKLNDENIKLTTTTKLQNENFEKMTKNYEMNKKDFKKQLGDYNLDFIIKNKEIEELKNDLVKINIQSKV